MIEFRVSTVYYSQRPRIIKESELTVNEKIRNLSRKIEILELKNIVS